MPRSREFIVAPKPTDGHPWGVASLALLLLMSFAPADTVEDRFPDGSTRSRYELINGVRWGPYAIYDERGHLIEQGAYRDGKLDGSRTLLHENGKVRIRESYKTGQLDGLRSEFDPDGNTLRSAEYRAGQLNGLLRQYAGAVPIVERTYIDGELVYPRSRAVIQRALARIRKTKIETAPADKPIPQHRGKNDSQADRETAVRMLMEYRYLCNVPYDQLQLDERFNAYAEAAAALLAQLGHLSHQPQNPGWPDEEYRFAATGAAYSNLALGRTTCLSSIHRYMDDSDPKNIERLGHRKWCLNPYLTRTGMASNGTVSAMWAMDFSRQDIGDIDHIAYPAAGLFPRERFGPRHAWSILLNLGKYAPADEHAKVTITPVEIDVKKALLRETRKPLELDHHKVQPNLLIFRPAQIEMKNGQAYRVSAEGLKTRDGKDATLKYIVEFYDD